MEEGQTPTNTYMVGDVVSFSFEFTHEMNVHRINVHFTHTNGTATFEAVGYPTLEDQAHSTKVSVVQVEGTIYRDTVPGRYDLRSVSVHTEGERDVNLQGFPAGVMIWVVSEPRTPPRFRRFLT